MRRRRTSRKERSNIGRVPINLVGTPEGGGAIDHFVANGHNVRRLIVYTAGRTWNLRSKSVLSDGSPRRQTILYRFDPPTIEDSAGRARVDRGGFSCDRGNRRVGSGWLALLDMSQVNPRKRGKTMNVWSKCLVTLGLCLAAGHLSAQEKFADLVGPVTVQPVKQAAQIPMPFITWGRGRGHVHGQRRPDDPERHDLQPARFESEAGQRG